MNHYTGHSLTNAKHEDMPVVNQYTNHLKQNVRTCPLQIRQKIYLQQNVQSVLLALYRHSLNTKF